MTPDPREGAPRRFYKAVAVEAVEGGYAVRLDGRTPRSPGGRPLILPSQGLAQLTAAEWDTQVDVIVIAAMPATRLAYTALEKAATVREGLADEAARYAGTDVVCYFAEAPAELARRQEAEWGAILAWAADDLGVRLQPVRGQLHAPQSQEAIERVRALALDLDDFALTALVHATALLGSAVLALALQRGRLTGDEAFDLSRLDEAFQEQHWGVDAEAAERTERLREETRMLERWFCALR